MPESSTIAGRVIAALIAAGHLSEDQLASACAGGASDAEAGRALLETGVVDETIVAGVVEDDLGVPSVDLSSYAPDDEALQRIPASIAKERDVLPLFEIEGMLTVAIGKATDIFRLDELSAELGIEIEPVLADAPAVSAALGQYYAETAEHAPEWVPPSAAEQVAEEPVWSMPDLPAEAPAPEPELVAAPEHAPEPAAAPELAPELEPATAPEPAAAPELAPEPEREPALEPAAAREPAAAPELEPATAPDPATALEPAPEVVFFDGVAIESDADELEISLADFFEVDDGTPVVVEAPTAVHNELGAAASLEGELSTPAASDAMPAPLAQTVEEVVAAPEESGGIDLDVLAVADDRKLAVLVSDILEKAVARGASRIHLLPYKNDFFLVFRVQGRLEKIASAPLSMQQPLIEGFKSFAKLARVTADLPALGRLHAEIGGKQLVLTVSSVPTVAGQRLVVSISASRPQPRTFVELGMSEAESRALMAMVERGRGILLVAAPVAGGRSSTYYALLSHAAQAGKTVYSVERSIEYEIPAVAQVLVNPGSPVGAASYFAAGMRQDTDVLAIDSMQSVEDVHLAIEAAGLGKLVIATFAGADIVSGVRRMLDLGAEPVSLASALTLGIGQRVVRLNCTDCCVDDNNPLADVIPGAEMGMTTRRGYGCASCGKTGFSGATGIFEVLPFTESVRARIARSDSAEQLEAAALAAGMRPMIASGLAKVRDGLVSPDELDRVLRFSA